MKKTIFLLSLLTIAMSSIVVSYEVKARSSSADVVARSGPFTAWYSSTYCCSTGGWVGCNIPSSCGPKEIAN